MGKDVLPDKGKVRSLCIDLVLVQRRVHLDQVQARMNRNAFYKAPLRIGGGFAAGKKPRTNGADMPGLHP